jgi:MFS family permease
LDFGLTIAQFSILNAVWAATIVLAEVPSGALADIVGRKRLLVFATAVMIVEIGIISFMPKINTSIVFIVFLINRVLSGLAEAAASGADEALAYDSLVELGISDQWGRVLEILSRFQSIGFIIAMSLGAAVYDPVLVTKVCKFFGADFDFTQEITMRFPLYLTFILAIGALSATIRMQEIIPKSSAEKSETDVRKAFALTFQAGTWILKTPFVLSVFLFGMLFDGIIRMVITLSSQYYRMIDLPESSFGLVGSFVAMLGLIIPKIARSIAENRSPSNGLFVAASLTFVGLISMDFFWPYAGLIPALITFSAMYFTGFFVSFYINKATASEQRATVLSFKGLAYNLSYGILGILYALLLKAEKEGAVVSQALENKIFMDTFIWFPGSFILMFIVLILIYLVWLRNPSN